MDHPAVPPPFRHGLGQGREVREVRARAAGDRPEDARAGVGGREGRGPGGEREQVLDGLGRQKKVARADDPETQGGSARRGQAARAAGVIGARGGQAARTVGVKFC